MIEIESNNQPDYDEDSDECNDGMLLDGSEESPFVTREAKESCRQLNTFFANAWIH